MTELLFREDAYLRSCPARILAADASGIVLDRTVFYPAGGGQPGDRGMLVAADGAATRILDTVKGAGPDEVLHVPAPDQPMPVAGASVEARLDWDRRYRIMRFHTCLHLLCAIVRAPVTGGRIAQDKAHLDFDVDRAALVREDIEARLDARIAEAHEVKPGWISDEELDANPQLVRTLSVQPPRGQGRVRTIDIAGVDLQPCGGTHVRNTAEIGRIRILHIRSEGRHNRRITIGFAAA